MECRFFQANYRGYIEVGLLFVNLCTKHVYYLNVVHSALAIFCD